MFQDQAFAHVLHLQKTFLSVFQFLEMLFQTDLQAFLFFEEKFHFFYGNIHLSE